MTIPHFERPSCPRVTDTEEETVEEITTTELSTWLDDETYGIEATAVAEALNRLLSRIVSLEQAVDRLEESSGHCDCTTCTG